MSNPLIGIPAAHEIDEYRRPRYYVLESYAQALLEAGGVPLIIPLNVMQHDDTSLLRSLYERLDGILLSGGGDVHPEFYDQHLSDTIARIDRSRDQVEIKLARWAFEDDRPLLGICRGSQVMNVALGGTLIHDIPSAVRSQLQHDQALSENPARLAHEVNIKADSRLATILGTDHLTVNSLHHQAVDQLASGLTISARAADDVIEGIEAPSAAFYIGIQWHPEWLTRNVPVMKKLFKAFVEACAEQTQPAPAVR